MKTKVSKKKNYPKWVNQKTPYYFNFLNSFSLEKNISDLTNIFNFSKLKMEKVKFLPNQKAVPSLSFAGPKQNFNMTSFTKNRKEKKILSSNLFYITNKLSKTNYINV